MPCPARHATGSSLCRWRTRPSSRRRLRRMRRDGCSAATAGRSFQYLFFPIGTGPVYKASNGELPPWLPSPLPTSHPPPLTALLSLFLRRLTPLSPAVHSLCLPRRRHTMAAPKTLPECWGHRGVRVCTSQSHRKRPADWLYGRCYACEGLSGLPGEHTCEFRARLPRRGRGDREW